MFFPLKMDKLYLFKYSSKLILVSQQSRTNLVQYFILEKLRISQFYLIASQFCKTRVQ